MNTTIGLFEAIGVEVEYMIVDRETLRVKPIADDLLRLDDGSFTSDVEMGHIAWSNELVLHVVELKTNGPASTLVGLADRFGESVREVNRRLAKQGACLMPTGMHPTMDPRHETTLWPHDYGPIYRTFDRIFDCSGHGWANLQATHINLPFKNDDEFARLHAAVRIVLPIIPALAASSPIMDGRITGWMDSRMEVYRHNASRVPSVSGLIVPEPATSRSHYESAILDPIYADLAPLDPDGILRFEWVNARGAIARFDRGTIEIRVLDVQECPSADMAVAAAILHVLRWLTEERTDTLLDRSPLSTDRLSSIFLDTTVNADETVIHDAEYLAALGMQRDHCRAADIWRHLLDQWLRCDQDASAWRPALDLILNEGCLARRIVRRLGQEPSLNDIHRAYRELTHCLDQGTLFRINP